MRFLTATRSIFQQIGLNKRAVCGPAEIFDAATQKNIVPRSEALNRKDKTSGAAA
jgi:hypothetical protein